MQAGCYILQFYRPEISINFTDCGKAKKKAKTSNPHHNILDIAPLAGIPSVSFSITQAFLKNHPHCNMSQFGTTGQFGEEIMRIPLSYTFESLPRDARPYFF